MEGSMFTTQMFGKEWTTYCLDLGLQARGNDWLLKTMSQAFDALSFQQREILAGVCATTALPVTQRWRNWLYENALEPFVSDRLSVYTANEILCNLARLREEEIQAISPVSIPVMADDSIIDISQEGGRINYEITVTETEPAPDEEEYNWRLGNKYRAKLGLSDQQVALLNKFYDPENSFLSVEGCCISTIKLYLSCLVSLEKQFEKRGSNMEQEVQAFVRKCVPASRGHTQEGRYQQQQVASAVYLTLFKKAESVIRNLYQHKRKINSNFSYSGFEQLFEDTFGKAAMDIMMLRKERIAAPDRETELRLNEMNPTRWKPAFDTIVAALTQENSGDISAQIDELAELNVNNPAYEQVFYEASRAFAKYDKLTAVRFYLKYIYADLHSEKIDSKQLQKTIQKSLFSTAAELQRFQQVIDELVGSKNLEKALESAPGIYEKQRKKIIIDEELLETVRINSSETIAKLNEILQEDEPGEEMIIQLPVQVNTVPDMPVTFSADLQLNDDQLQLMKLFSENNCTLPADTVTHFARERQLFKNRLIESINDACYEQLDDVLIEEINDGYEMNVFYYQKIVNLC